MTRPGDQTLTSQSQGGNSKHKATELVNLLNVQLKIQQNQRLQTESEKHKEDESKEGRKAEVFQLFLLIYC